MAQNSETEVNSWLPTSVKEVKALGWKQLDVIIFTGDAYVDHPSFGVAIIARLLESLDLKVAVVPQPNWQDDLRDFKKLGKPRLFFGVTAGNMDSMVNHYTANKRLRSNDAFTPGNNSGHRPDYASYVYTSILKRIFPETPVIIGGIEASLRRFTHYDYWSEKLKPGILAETKADLLFYGMAEKSLTTFISIIKDGWNKKEHFFEIAKIPQIAYCVSKEEDYPVTKEHSIELHSHEDCLKSKIAFAKNFAIIETESNKWESNQLIQNIGNNKIIVNPPHIPSSDELDNIYKLPFTRLPHPKYQKKPPIPAYEMIRHSIILHRGCFGGCAFCTISAHQGKFIQSRSENSIIQEARQIVEMHDFKGYISDLGGPSANMYKLSGKNPEQCINCKRPSCLTPSICKNLNTDHNMLLNIYQKVRKLNGIKKAFVSSGLRYDLFLQKNPEQSHKKYFSELVQHHVSGRLKVAPEHTSNEVLKIMRKPKFTLFKKLKTEFEQLNKNFGINQQLIPYFISSHPACEIKDMAELAIEVAGQNIRLEQVQDFTPTPMTLATVMYYTGLNPYTLKSVKVAKTKRDKLNQQAFFFAYKAEKKREILSVLKRENLDFYISKIFKTSDIKRKPKNRRNRR